jgi:hypothetical protein
MNPVLIYTIALDAEGQTTQRSMAKILASSLLRSYFTGDILILHNGTAPLFRVERRGVEERMLTLPPGTDLMAAGCALKYRARSWIPEGYEWVCFLDCDMIALRNIDHLFDPGAPADILWQPEPSRMRTGSYSAYFTDAELPHLWPEGANAGSWAVRGVHYRAVMEEWERINHRPPERPHQSHDQPAWNRLLYDTPLRRRRFEKEEIMFPLLFQHSYRNYREAALLHPNGCQAAVKLEFLMGQFLGRYFGEPAELILGMVEP